jgi:hypothetical protein
MTSSKTDLNQADRLFGAVVAAQQDVAVCDLKLTEARALRDQAIVDAAEMGYPRRALAQATNLTPGRIQQIIDRAIGDGDRPAVQPTLRMERERRQRSQLLAERVRRHAEDAAARER